MARFIALLLAALSTCSAMAADQPSRAEQPNTEQQYNASLVDSLLAEGTPRALILAATALPYAGDTTAGQTRQELLDQAARMAPDDAFVQWFAALYAEPATTLSEPAKAVLRLEPDNGAAWMFSLQAASKAKDENGIDDALTRIGAASAFDEHYIEFTLEWIEKFEAHPRPAQPGLDPEQGLSEEPLIMAIARSAALASPAFSSLVSACGDMNDDSPPGRRDACMAAGRLMASQSTAIISRGMGIALLRRNGAPEASTAMREFKYLLYGYTTLSNKLACDPLEFGAFEADWLETRNEIRVVERTLLRAGLPLQPPPDWQPDSTDAGPPGHEPCAG